MCIWLNIYLFQSEPIDDDENEDIYVEDEPSAAVVDLEISPPLPVATLDMSKIVTTLFPVTSVESTVLPKIASIDGSSSEATSLSHHHGITTRPCNGSITENVPITHNSSDQPKQRDEANDQPETAFLETTNSASESTSDRFAIQTDDSNAYNEIVCAVSTLSGAVGTLSTALNGLSPHLTPSGTKAL